MRDKVTRHDPRLVTMKCAKGLPSLRSPNGERVVLQGLRLAQRAAFRVVGYSIQSNHLHLLVEADDANALANGMRSLTCRVARGLNKLRSRRGAVFPRRFHDVVLRLLRQVRNALRYVLNNHLEHRASMPRHGAAVEPDRYSSARYFDGWADQEPELEAGAPGACVAAGGWKVRVGWKRHDRLIGVAEAPGSLEDGAAA